ncbi:MAG TPA: hypothetical protein VFR63_00875 [Gaiellaceae bacterium]|nr:hypothetical protein [Gaiellaceae bacterium]
MTRLELTCETCGSRIAEPPAVDTERPVKVCCKASLARAKRERFEV